MSAGSDTGLLLSNDQLKQCRICLDTDNPDDIISPCLCTGNSAYVHRTCLNYWRAENKRGKGLPVVDRWGGCFNESKSKPYENVTLHIPFSTRIGSVGTTVSLYVQRGLLNYSSPIIENKKRLTSSNTSENEIDLVRSYPNAFIKGFQVFENDVKAFGSRLFGAGGSILFPAQGKKTCICLYCQ
ncbi:unnamed protein product [Rotaria sp. Silwood1]|nr:unnamed protein product [Rotaria sp. Silwood1]